MDSCAGLMSSEVDNGRYVVILLPFVDCTFFCCVRIRPLLVAMLLLRCLMLRSWMNLGRVSKWHF